VIGIGLDAVEIDRFRRVLQRRPGFAARVFTAAERGDLAGRLDPVPGLAARFAAKEAAMKALGVGLWSIGLTELEVRSAEDGAPHLRASGRAAERALALGVASFHVSLTHTARIAGAVVVAE